MLAQTRELVLVGAEVSPEALRHSKTRLVGRWSHRLLDPLLLEQLEACATGQSSDVAPVVLEPRVTVFELPVSLRRAMVALAPDSPAVTAWLSNQLVQASHARPDEVPALLACFRRAAMSLALNALDHAYLRTWYTQPGLLG